MIEVSKVFGGRYEVLEQIGTGGMAVVYKAKDVLLNRIVTIKVLREQFGSDEEFLRRFRREAQSAASLSHSNIVSIYDVGKDGDIEYIVMEYIEGRNLKEIIRNYAPLSPEQAILIAKQIGEAIHHAHEHHIIHRDIKPQNILVTAEGKVKVTDFGIARAVSSATVTHTGNIVGSVHYLSPEQAKGVQTNEQSDIYSLGIILYELVTGKVPYDGETPIAIALKHLQEEAVPPSKLNPRIGQELENVIMRAVAKSPDTRYPTARELLKDLDRVQAGLPVEWSKPKEIYDIGATIVHKSLSKEIAEASKADTPRPKKKWNKRWIWAVVLGAVLILLGGTGLWARNYVVGASTTVPPLEGLNVPDAGKALQAAKLVLAPNPAEEFNDKMEKGKVIRQIPASGSSLKEGKEVTVVVSKGPDMAVFPDLINPPVSKDNALTNLQNFGFTAEPTIETRPGLDIPEGMVVEQDPAPKTPWAKSGPIHLVVSGGPLLQTISMPNVVGVGAAEARKILQDNKLNDVVVNSEPSNTYPRDVVISTTPKANESVQQGSQVTMVISGGPGPMARELDQRMLLANLLHAVPNDGKTHNVAIKINDSRGQVEVWQGSYQVGMTEGVPDGVRYYPPAVMQILVDGTIEYEDKVS
ncbi:Stk1 family PASTA domain-containing Ser/Thr kinase [Paradesulfitobacterium aromaticivorans]